MVVALLLAGGMSLLLAGGHYLVSHAVRLATALNVPPLAIGLTIVAFGTSAPELVISLDAVLTGHDDIVIGNIIGSSIFNLLGITGITAMASPITVAPRFLGMDFGLMLAASIGVISCGVVFGRLGRMTGAVMGLAYAGYMIQLG
ncbi:MAG: hypothetical protein VXW17_07960 [Pseudomonadota bacterium]|nr:hypothetical protein [Pseudomonadota bacterium]MEC7237949.1 hypothetical protein [Pseudomonadota bacterium]